MENEDCLTDNKNKLLIGVLVESSHLSNALAFRHKEQMGRWMSCEFTSFSTVFQSYQDNAWVIMKDCAQWNSV